MSDQAMKDGPVWDITKSGPLAFLRFFPELVDHAVLVEQASSIDGLGVAPELFTVVDFTAYFGQAPQPPRHLQLAMQSSYATGNF